MGRPKIDRTGEIGVNNYGTKMKIVEYDTSKHMIVKFLDIHETMVSCEYSKFLRGDVKNPYDRSVYNKGFLGQGKHLTSIDGKHTKKYEVWISMLERCYNSNKDRNRQYLGVTVCSEWLNFQKFGDWFDKNYYEVDNEKMEIDKDILSKGNKVYSKNTCIFVPHNVNILFINRGSDRGNYPVGVYFRKDTNKFKAQCSNQILNKQINIGQYETSELAFKAYKHYKENHIKEVADLYRDKIPKRLYDAMLKYKVEITD